MGRNSRMMLLLSLQQLLRTPLLLVLCCCRYYAVATASSNLSMFYKCRVLVFRENCTLVVGGGCVVAEGLL